MSTPLGWVLCIIGLALIGLGFLADWSPPVVLGVVFIIAALAVTP